MSTKAIFDTAPLGAIIQYSDGRAQPPKRFTRKFAAGGATTERANSFASHH